MGVCTVRLHANNKPLQCRTCCLQARELLAEVRVDYVREDAVDVLLEQLRTALQRMPECTLEPDAADGFCAALGAPPVRPGRLLCTHSCPLGQR